MHQHPCSAKETLCLSISRFLTQNKLPSKHIKDQLEVRHENPSNLLQILPNEIWSEVLEYLDLKTLTQVLTVCRQWYAIQDEYRCVLLKFLNAYDNTDLYCCNV